MNRYRFTLTGRTPLIMHRDDVDWADMISAWSKDPNNKAKSVAGDDRSPAFTYLGYFYRDGDGTVGVPQENLHACLIRAGAKVPHPVNKRESMKATVACGLFFEEISFPLSVNGNGPLSLNSLPTNEEMDFSAHASAAREAGFRLLVKRASVGQSKHVRVRPCFDVWSAVGHVNVDPDIKKATLQSVFDVAGMRIGLCDWRPGAPKAPGPYGTFTVELAKG